MTPITSRNSSNRPQWRWFND